MLDSAVRCRQRLVINQQIIGLFTAGVPNIIDAEDARQPEDPGVLPLWRSAAAHCRAAGAHRDHRSAQCQASLEDRAASASRIASDHLRANGTRRGAGGWQTFTIPTASNSADAGLVLCTASSSSAGTKGHVISVSAELLRGWCSASRMPWRCSHNQRHWEVRAGDLRRHRSCSNRTYACARIRAARCGPRTCPLHGWLEVLLGNLMRLNRKLPNPADPAVGPEAAADGPFWRTGRAALPGAISRLQSMRGAACVRIASSQCLPGFKPGNHRFS